MLPQTFQDWKNCITKDCKINLTKEFAQERLKVYQNNKNSETLKFVSLYGREHLKNIIEWLKLV